MSMIPPNSFSGGGSDQSGGGDQNGLWQLLSGLFGGQNQTGDFQNNDALWNWGVSPFDWNAIMGAMHENLASMAARYNQLGLKAPGGGPSTAEQMDLGQLPSETGGIPGQSEALIGELQTQNAGNPALNPALQPVQQDQVAQQNATGNAQTLGTLAGLAGNFV